MERRTPRWVAPVREFLQTESAGGIVLMGALVVALVWANSPVAASYDALWHHELTLPLGPLSITEDLQHWVNDALMTLFFFVVGLEIKREMVTGELRDPRAAALPAIAALGGMVFPALIYVVMNAGGPGGDGWGIPMATDIAFALGVVSLFGTRAPAGLKVFLLSVAIVDDIGAILVIALFYSTGISGAWLAAAFGAWGVIVLMRIAGVSRPLFYVPLGVAMWFFTFESGVHATIAGVILGLTTPATPVGGRHVLEDLTHRLHPFVAFGIVPLFALANSGVGVGIDALASALTSPVAAGVAVGLVAGKLFGIWSLSALAVRLKIARLPGDVGLDSVFAAAAFAGIGFTVSLFIANLSFQDLSLLNDAKIGILIASVVSAVLGSVLLLRVRKRTAAADEPAGV